MKAVDELLGRFAEYSALQGGIRLMYWDMQVLMPPGGAGARGEHIERLTRMSHAMLTSDEMRRSVEDAGREAAPDSDEAAMVECLKRDLSVQVKLPAELVSRKAKASSVAYDTWKRAKPANDFAALRPHLEELFEIAKETSQLLSVGGHPYDALIDLFEEGATHAEARAMFDSIKPFTIDLVREIQEGPVPVDDSALYGEWSAETLRGIGQTIAEKVGFDFKSGILNIAPNAFCTNLSPSDVRMTARPSDHIKGVLSSTLHEMGHGLYEQGGNPAWTGTPLAGGVSLAVHESQSRLWENIVARSRGFWSYFAPLIHESLPSLRGMTGEQLYRSMSLVKAEPVRVGADELTYNLHILVRFELESEIVKGALAVKDLPDAWNEKYRKYLGILPRTDTEGCLQDVHWTRGSVGYFPTYSMGNIIGAQIWEVLCREVGDTEGLMARGEFGPILSWLQDRVYRHGRRFKPKELVRKIVGTGLDTGPWMRYAGAKYGVRSS